jgi:hypothetical protein
VHVMIQLRPDVAREAHAVLALVGHPPSPSEVLARLLALVAKHGLALSTVHPGATDAGLVPYFLVDAPDSASAERLLKALRQVDGVDGAYLGAQSEPP